MSSDLVWYSLRWPREVKAEREVLGVQRLAAAGGTPIVIEAIGQSGRVDHRISLLRGRAGGMIQQLRAAIPGLGIEKLPSRPELFVNRVVELRFSTNRRSLQTDNAEAVSQALLTALAHVGREELLVLQFVLGRQLRPLSVANRLPSSGSNSIVRRLLGDAPHDQPSIDVEARNALRAKQAEAGWQAVCRIGVRAEMASRQRQLIGQVLGALRGAEAPGVRIFAVGRPPKHLVRASNPWRRALRLKAGELATLVAWPIGDTRDLPVQHLNSRVVGPSRAIPREGRIIAQSTFPGRERPLALSPVDACRHFHCLGPAGSGKSTALENMIAQDIADDRSVVVTDPKGDLIDAVLTHIPPKRMNEVVLLDPTDIERPVGLNPLTRMGRSPELVADQLLGLFHSLYESWGPRTQEVLHAALLTLAQQPNATLVDLLLLLTDAGFRRRCVAKLDDPIVLEPWWAAYEEWSEQERAMAIAPATRRLRPFLLRPDVRAIVGQPKPRFDIRQLFTERKILLVNLAKGSVGPETAALLGGLVTSMLWQATLERATVPIKQRQPVFIYIDEFQDYLRMPTDFADALAQARGLGVGFILAHQYLGQLPSSMVVALANVQSKMAFRLPHTDARVLAAGSTLDPEDFENLDAYHCYLQLVAGGTVQPFCSARTSLPPRAVSKPEEVRAASRENFGIDRDEIDQAFRRIPSTANKAEPDDLTPRRRVKKGAS